MNEGNVKHGALRGVSSGKTRRDPVYKKWCSIREKCNNKNTRDYKKYGAMGIVVCSEWLEFPVFQKWMLEQGYPDKKLLFRHNKSENYSPNNCYLSSTRHNKRYLYKEEWLTLEEIKRKTFSSLSNNIVRQRLARGWDILDACLQPTSRKVSRKIFISHPSSYKGGGYENQGKTKGKIGEDTPKNTSP